MKEAKPLPLLRSSGEREVSFVVVVVVVVVAVVVCGSVAQLASVRMVKARKRKESGFSFCMASCLATDMPSALPEGSGQNPQSICVRYRDKTVPILGMEAVPLLKLQIMLRGVEPRMTFNASVTN